jgi:hypothetical protein
MLGEGIDYPYLPTLGEATHAESTLRLIPNNRSYGLAHASLDLEISI